MEMRFLLVLEHLESILKRCRPKSFSAGPPAPLDLAFPWISITGKEMLTFRKTQWYFGRKRVKVNVNVMFNGGKR
jgi:hypothetical protein